MVSNSSWDSGSVLWAFNISFVIILGLRKSVVFTGWAMVLLTVLVYVCKTNQSVKMIGICEYFTYVKI